MEQAEKRINNALQNNLTSLDLISLELKSLPSNFLELAPRLKELHLTNNKFDFFPRELGACTNLEILFFANNQLTDIYGLASLTKLKELVLENNKLNYFPTEILELKLLEKLNLDHNDIPSIPQGILELQNLTQVRFFDNKIETLPQEIVQLPNLISIDIAQNPLKTPPLEIALRGMSAIRGYFKDYSKKKKKEGRNYLLSIAIDQYDDPSFSPQKGRVKEAKELATVLENKFNYSKTELYNNAATEDNIYNELFELIEITTDQDAVIFYFSGQIADAYEIGLFSYYRGEIPADFIFEEISRMKAQHVLVIIDFYFYTSSGSQSRNVGFEKENYNSRWILHRQNSEWENRFTPNLTNFLQNLTFEVGVGELKSVLKNVVIAPLNLGGDEGGMFNFQPSENEESNVDPVQEILDSNTSNDLDKIKENLRSYIARANLKKLFKELNQIVDSESSTFNELILLNGRFNGLKNDNIKGIITPERYDIQLNQINYSLLDLIDELKLEDIKKEARKTTKPPFPNITITSKKLIQKIKEKIPLIENLRKEYLDTTSISQKEVLLQKINIELAELERLRESEGIISNISKEETDTSNFLEEERLWQNALQKNSISDYQNYLDKTEIGTYRQEAARALNDLNLKNQEEKLYQLIEIGATIERLNSYRSLFPNGKYIKQANEIYQRFEREEEELWETTELENTLSAYNNYLEITKIRTHQRAALKKIKRLESEHETTRINEAKLILVGNGRVGKTSLSKRLLHNKFDPNEPTTHGIRIKKWPFKLDDGRTVQVNLWDFGGQQIYHNTHRFFLTNRALYLLVWDENTQLDAVENPDKEKNFVFDYWLENISSLSDGSPIILVQNKMDEKCSKGFDLSLLMANAEWNVKDSLKVSAAKAWNMDGLQKTISEQFQKAPKLKDLIGYDLGEGWLAVRKQLEDLAQKNPYIPFDDYLKICQEHEISEENAVSLSIFLTDIGVIIHFPENDVLKEMVILNPRWTTKIIYRFLNEKIKKNKGKFRKTDLEINMDDEVQEHFSKAFRFRNDREVQIFLELMVKFKICFELPDEEGTFIVPQFLEEEKPNFDWDSKCAIKYGYHYGFLHNGIIANIIVQLSEFAHKKNWWRNGVVLEKEGILGKIESFPKLNQIQIEIIGTDADGFKKYKLNDIFEKANQRLDVETILYCTEKNCLGTFKEEDILKLESENQKQITCGICKNNISIDSILGKNIENRSKLKIFISYAHKDEAYKDTLQTWLQSLQYSFEMNVWDDRQIEVGDNWEDEISKALNSAEFIILLISVDFLNSRFIKEVELKRAFERHQKGETVIMPIIIRPCLWNQKPLNEIQVIPKDGNPISLYKNADQAWYEVTEMINKRLE